MALSAPIAVWAIGGLEQPLIADQAYPKRIACYQIVVELFGSEVRIFLLQPINVGLSFFDQVGVKDVLGQIVAKTRRNPGETGPGCPQSIR